MPVVTEEFMITRKLLYHRLTLPMAFATALLSLPCFAQDAPPPVPAPPAATEQQPMQVGPTIKKESRLVLFFDNSSMALPDQISARGAAAKFIESNAAPDHLMAVVEFTGAIRVLQNFTANAELLQAAAKGVKTSFVASNSDPGGPGASTAAAGISSFSNAETDYGARSMLLSVRALAKNLRTIPGRKMLVLFSSGF